MGAPMLNEASRFLVSSSSGQFGHTVQQLLMNYGWAASSWILDIGSFIILYLLFFLVAWLGTRQPLSRLEVCSEFGNCSIGAEIRAWPRHAEQLETVRDCFFRHSSAMASCQVAPVVSDIYSGLFSRYLSQITVLSQFPDQNGHEKLNSGFCTTLARHSNFCMAVVWGHARGQFARTTLSDGFELDRCFR